MSAATLTPETMTAADRRQAWFEDELKGHSRSSAPDAFLSWDYGDEIIDILRGHFLSLEHILGAEQVGHSLFALLHGPNVEGDTWREALERYSPSWNEKDWPSSLMLDKAGIYGFYGVTPEEIAHPDRAGWIETLVQRLEAFRAEVRPKPGGVIDRITNLALSRRAIETCTGEVDLVSLGILGGVSEGRVRNILSASDSPLTRGENGITADSAADWLKGRKEFFASIWQQPDEVPPAPPSADFTGPVVFVPVAGDGSAFGPELLRNGHYTVGAKKAEVQYRTFEEALDALHRMDTPRWRRPNPAGNWGIVSGRDWKRIEKK